MIYFRVLLTRINSRSHYRVVGAEIIDVALETVFWRESLLQYYLTYLGSQDLGALAPCT